MKEHFSKEEESQTKDIRDEEGIRNCTAQLVQDLSEEELSYERNHNHNNEHQEHFQVIEESSGEDDHVYYLEDAASFRHTGDSFSYFGVDESSGDEEEFISQIINSLD